MTIRIKKGYFIGIFFVLLIIGALAIIYLDFTIEWSDYIDSDVIREIETQSSASVTVIMKEGHVDDVMSVLSENDMIISHSFDRSFSGYIRKSGLIKLNNRDDITRVYITPMTHAADLGVG